MQPPRRPRFRRGRRAAALTALACFALAFLPASAVAHGGGAPSLLVPLDHVVPGSPFAIEADDFEAGVALRLSLTRDATTAVDLGSAVTDADGHAQVAATLPAGYPFGYAQVIATGDDGTAASTWIRVGDSTYTSPGGSSLVSGRTGSVEGLLAAGVLGLLLAAVLVVVALRRRAFLGS